MAKSPKHPASEHHLGQALCLLTPAARAADRTCGGEEWGRHTFVGTMLSLDQALAAQMPRGRRKRSQLVSYVRGQEGRRG